MSVKQTTNMTTIHESGGVTFQVKAPNHPQDGQANHQSSGLSIVSRSRKHIALDSRQEQAFLHPTNYSTATPGLT
jgi:hypothetical protein